MVGLIPDSEIRRCKGPPVMSDAERHTMVESVKWVDEVITGASHRAHRVVGAPFRTWQLSIWCQSMARSMGAWMRPPAGADLAQLKPAANHNRVAGTRAIRCAGSRCLARPHAHVAERMHTPELQMCRTT